MMDIPLDNYIFPNWPAPVNIKACTTTRVGGVGVAPFDSFNLSLHVGDDPETVKQNRAKLKADLDLPSEPMWLKQAHTTRVVEAVNFETNVTADASVSYLPDRVCVVQTADCLPILLCDVRGTRVAAIHGGWRSLLSGIVEETAVLMQSETAEVMAWLGPAIGVSAFEVGADVREAFIDKMPEAAAAFHPVEGSEKWHADICLLAKQRLNRVGVTAVYGGGFCTVSDSKRFFSYRKEGEATGRMASLIWMTN